MDRRTFLSSALALVMVGCTATSEAAPFRPTRFTVEVSGSGPDVILIPGLTAGRGIWRPTLAALPGYRYHLVEVAGFAGSPAAGNVRGPVIAPLADEIAAYIADRRLDRPALVGHSMGGTLAMMVASKQPRLAGRVMVVDMLPEPSALVGGNAASFGPLATSLKGLLGSEGGRSMFASLLGAFSPPGSANRKSDPDVVARAMHELASIDLTPELRKIEAPLAIVYASPAPNRNALMDRHFARAYAPRPGTELIRIDSSGHMVMLDQPQPFHQALARFLRPLSATRR